jgi:hypothetical protein
MSSAPLKTVEISAFSNQLDDLRDPVRVVVMVAIENILLEQGMGLANGNWLKYVGGGVWEFRIGKSVKAVHSKAGFPSNKQLSNFSLLIRIFCGFEDGVVVLLGCYDKQRFSSGNRQSAAIDAAKQKLLTYRRRS